MFLNIYQIRRLRWKDLRRAHWSGICYCIFSINLEKIPFNNEKLWVLRDIFWFASLSEVISVGRRKERIWRGYLVYRGCNSAAYYSVVKVNYQSWCTWLHLTTINFEYRLPKHGGKGYEALYRVTSSTLCWRKYTMILTLFRELRDRW